MMDKLNITKNFVAAMLLPLFMVVSLFFSTYASASEVSNISTQKYSGDVTRIDGRKLTVKVDDQTKELSVPETISIRRNSMNAKIDEIKVNDKVEWTQSNDGSLVSLSVTSGKLFDYGKWAIPGVLIVLLIIGLIAYLTKKKNEGHIKTPTEQVNN